MNHPFSYTVIRSARKTLAIQIKSDGSVLVRCPRAAKQSDIDRILCQKSEWIIANLQNVHKYEALPCFTESQLKLMKQEAQQIIPMRTREISQKIGIPYNRITIRCQRTRWGSCSSKGNLNFNSLLVLAPPEVMDYVIIHELCHRLEMNHSSAFWKHVETHCPGYRSHRNWLKSEGIKLCRRLPQ